MPSEIIWINHAGYELRTGGIRIVHDPWLSGLAFDNGWSLLSKTVYEPVDFDGVDYIWFSHEHPDHFAPSNLKSIPFEIRRRITVLFQKTKDGRVARFCENLGFQVVELDPGVQTYLNDVVSVKCSGVLGGDSWLYLASDDITIFNANDCVGVDWKSIARSLERPVDILMTQFSFANWVGNPGEQSRMRAAANQKLHEMRMQVDALSPRSLIPFASFVWFCRADNFHMNAHMNRIADVERLMRSLVSTIVLYPGEKYIVGTEHNNSSAIERYTADFENIEGPLVIDEPSVSMGQLEELSRAEQERLKKQNHLWMIWPLEWIGYIRPVCIFLSDLEEGLTYSMFGGIRATNVPLERCDLAMRSNSFALMLKSGYGFGTLTVNGRYRELIDGATSRLSRSFAIAARNSEGFFVPSVFLSWKYIWAKINQYLRINYLRP